MYSIVQCNLWFLLLFLGSIRIIVVVYYIVAISEIEPCGNGGVTANYWWTQTLEDLTVIVLRAVYAVLATQSDVSC